MSKTFTRGGIIVEDIKIGDIHYEYEYGCCIKSTVKTLPIKEDGEDDVYYTWISVTDNGHEINYGVNSKHSHYGPNLYNLKRS